MVKSKAFITKRAKISLRDFEALEKFYDIKNTKFRFDYIKRKNGDIWVDPWIVHSSDGKVTAKLIPMIRLAPEGTLEDLYKIQVTYSISVNETQMRSYIKDLNKLFRSKRVSPRYVKGEPAEVSWDKCFKASYGSETSTKENIKERDRWIRKSYRKKRKSHPNIPCYDHYHEIQEELKAKKFGKAQTDLSLDSIRRIINRRP